MQPRLPSGSLSNTSSPTFLMLCLQRALLSVLICSGDRIPAPGLYSHLPPQRRCVLRRERGRCSEPSQLSPGGCGQFLGPRSGHRAVQAPTLNMILPGDTLSARTLNHKYLLS